MNEQLIKASQERDQLLEEEK